ncbi:myb family transcription factor [Salix suchowensis]|nr:myb family transcription factor [Salix suchowensis]
MGGLSPWQDLELATSTDITPSQFDQLAATFCTSECLLDFQLDDDYEIATFPSSSQVPVPNDAKMPSCQSSRGNIFDESSWQTSLGPYLFSNQHHKYCGKIQKYLSTIDSGGSTSLSLERVQVLGDNATLIGGQLQPPSDRQNDPEVTSRVSQQLESSTRHLGDGYSTCSGSGSSGPIFSSKKRIRWTQGLHEKFVECVNSLGGAGSKSKTKGHTEDDGNKRIDHHSGQKSLAEISI